MAKTNTTLQVKGMSCEHCVNVIESALKNLSGVEMADVDLKANKVTVSYDDAVVKLENIKDAIEDQGYDVI